MLWFAETQKCHVANRVVFHQPYRTRVIEGNAPAPNGKSTAKRTAGSLQKALSDRRSPFNRSSLSPLPTSPAISNAGSPSLLPTDAASQQVAEKNKQARSPIIHELAFKEQSYDMLWQKYPGSSEADFKNALDKVADLDEDTHNYILRKKYWRELDVWRHDYASDEERQQAIDNAIRQFDKMRLSTTEPEWERLLPREERGQGRILSKVQVSIAKGAAAPKIRVQKADDSSAESGHANHYSSESGNGSGSNRTDEEGADSEVTLSPSRHTTTGAAKKKLSAREAQEKRLLSTNKKKSPPTSAPAARSTSPNNNATTTTSTKVSPAKSAAARAKANENLGKFKSKEFVSESDTSDSESESAPLASTVHHHTKLAGGSSSVSKPSPIGSTKAASAKAASATPPVSKERASSAAAAPVRKAAKPSPVKESAQKVLLPPKPPLRKRARDYDDDDSSSSSSSGTPLSKRIKPLKSTAAKPSSTLRDARDAREVREAREAREARDTRDARDARDAREAREAREARDSRDARDARDSREKPRLSAQPAARTRNVSPNGSSSSGSGGNRDKDGGSNSTSSKAKNTSPVKSSPLASSPPTNASELDLSSEESVPPIGTTNTSKKRKMVDDHRNSLMAAEASSKNKKRRGLPEDLVDKALRFKVYYEKYEALYRDIAGRNNPPKDRVAELLKMHTRLQEMKNDIHNEATMRA